MSDLRSIKSYKLTVILFLVLCIVTSVRLAFSWLGGMQFWGLDYIKYFDVSYLVGFSLLPFLFLIPGIRKSMTHFLMDTVVKKKAYFMLLVTILLVLFVSFRMETFFYGDGGLLPPQIYKLGLDQNADKSLLLNMKSSPLAGIYLVALVYAVPYLYNILGLGAPLSAIYPFIYFSASAFIIALLFLLTVKDPRERIVYLITLLSSAGALLFFGYVEYYVFAFVAIFIYLVSVKQYIMGRIEFKYVIISFIFCLVSHYYSLALLPSLLFVVVMKYKGRLRKNISFKRVLAVLSVSLLVGLIVYFVSGLYETDNRIVIPFESVANRSGAHQYTLLSINHIKDLFNVIVLFAPIQLLIALLIIFKEKGNALNWKLAIFYLITIFYFLVFIVFSNASLTLARDWDLAAPLGLMFAMLLTEMLMEKKMYREVLLVSVIQIVFLIPWFAVNIDAAKSAKRFENVVEYGKAIIYPDYMLSGYEALRKYYEHNNQSRKELHVLKKMVALLNYPQHYRLFINRNERISVLDNDRYTENQVWIIKSLVKKRNALKWKSLPMDYSISMNQVDSLLEAVALNSYKNNVLDRILSALNKDERDIIRNRNSLVGVRAFEEGKLELAANAFARCLEAEFHDPKIYVLYGSALEKLRKLDKAEKVLLNGINRFPDNPDMKIALAFVYIRNGIKKEKARNLLMQAEDNALDDQQKTVIRELKKYL